MNWTIEERGLYPAKLGRYMIVDEALTWRQVSWSTTEKAGSWRQEQGARNDKTQIRGSQQSRPGRKSAKDAKKSETWNREPTAENRQPGTGNWELLSLPLRYMYFRKPSRIRLWKPLRVVAQPR